MGTRSVEEEVLALIARVMHDELGIERIVTRSSTLGDELELDSMGLTVVAVALEDHFRVCLDETDARLATAGALADSIARRVREREVACA